MSEIAVTFLFRVRSRDTHVRVAVHIGPPTGHRALSGELVMRPEEWDAFKFLVEGSNRVEIDDEVVGVAVA